MSKKYLEDERNRQAGMVEIVRYSGYAQTGWPQEQQALRELRETAAQQQAKAPKGDK